MAFYLVLPDVQQAYLDGLPISAGARAYLGQHLQQDVANVSEEFRLDPSNRPDPQKPCFLYQHVFCDQWGDRHWHQINFYLNDSKAESGVLILVYVEHHPGAA